ncbi:DNA polymerase IV [Natronospira bacteriovora]|uniref:DNA polymerase IV n=1 Tax=Natronospira bacteriovora TaxID=3069753 RepID=A0ABU0WA01_9GAMM|nr:DNA polymerase IV [Natronospira sp. AB-CW4]MDQ2070872.1 DNA polymerase IV [Natronospira sp. AB-CW4]
MADRLILHVDLDAFYASVEQLDNPELQGRPVIVGGLGGRGVVSAASYEARRFGVHSAMPGARARQLCPEGVFLAPRMARYRELSAIVFDCFRALTPLVEGLSLDEAFLDLSADPGAREHPKACAQGLREQIRARTGLVASVGIAPNKFVAKLASDLGKPDGLVHVSEAGLRAFLDPLPVERLWGVGEATTARLRRADIRSFGALRRTPEPRLRALVGRQAPRLLALARGDDHRAVTPERTARSISTERTFDRDLKDRSELQTLMADMAEQVAARLRSKSLQCRTVAVKLRSPDFRTFSRQQSLGQPSDAGPALRRIAQSLADEWWRQQGPRPRLRLAGVVARDLLENTGQMGLFTGRDTAAGKDRDTDRLLDAARERFGEGLLRRGMARGKRSDSEPGV